MQSEHNRERVRQAFAARLRQALEELGYTPRQQGRLQRLFGVSGQAVRKWLEGSALPMPSRMPELAHILGVRRAWLQDGEGPMRPFVGVRDELPKMDEAVPLDPEEARLLASFRRLTHAQQQAIRLIIHSLSEGGAG